jgi:hypothetical protein
MRKFCWAVTRGGGFLSARNRNKSEPVQTALFKSQLAAKAWLAELPPEAKHRAEVVRVKVVIQEV